MDSIYVHRLYKYMSVADSVVTCNSPVPLDQLMELYRPLNAEVLAKRIRLSIALNDPLQLAADIDRIFSVVTTDDDVCTIMAIDGLGEIKSAIDSRSAAVLAKPHHARLNEYSRIQMLHHLAEPRAPRKEGSLTGDFIRGMRGRVPTTVLEPLAIEYPVDMFDLAEFTTPQECANIHTTVRDMCAAILDVPLSDNLFVYNFTEALRKYVLAANKTDIDTATLAVSPLYSQLGAGSIFASKRPSIVRGFAHYKSTLNPKVTVVLNQVNYNVPKILYTGTKIHASAEFLADDLRLFVDISLNNIQK